MDDTTFNAFLVAGSLGTMFAIGWLWFATTRPSFKKDEGTALAWLILGVVLSVCVWSLTFGLTREVLA